MHGGKSTGPRTPEGLERSRRARWKHGRYSQETRRARIAAIEADQARIWTEVADWAPAAGFIMEPVRRRGFHGVRAWRPHLLGSPRTLCDAVLKAERKRLLKARRLSRA